MKKIVFVAGPFKGDGSIENKKRNIESARNLIVKLIKNNIPYYSPHLNIDQEVLSIDEDVGEFSWELNAEFLRRCDALAVLSGWEESGGTKQEIENAKARNLPIFYLSEKDSIEKIKVWLNIE